jgi:hypothetical protein
MNKQPKGDGHIPMQKGTKIKTLKNVLPFIGHAFRSHVFLILKIAQQC